MKKPGSNHRTPDRRKRTNAEIKHNNAVRSARQAEAEQPKLCWDDLQNIFNQAVRSLASVAGTSAAIRTITNNKELLSHLTNTQRFTDVTTVFARDMTLFNNKLNAIQVKHAGKTGEAVETDDFFDAAMIGQEYHAWMGEFDSVVVPLASEILSTVDTAVASFNAASVKTEGDTP